MSGDKVLKEFEDAGALLRGHFKLTSGRHSDVYYEKFALLKNPKVCTAVCQHIAAHFERDRIQTVVGPTLGGVIIAYEVARYLGIQAVYAEAGDGGRVLKRGFSLVQGERILIVDDVLTTGRSIKEVIELASSYQADVAGIGIILDRSGGEVRFDYPLYSVATIRADSWSAEECPLCEKGESLTQRGSRVH